MKENILVIFTQHDGDVIDEQPVDQEHPEMTFYTFTKGALEVVDEMKMLYSVATISC